MVYCKLTRKTFFMWPLLKQRRFFSSWTFRPFRIRVEKCQIFNKKCEKTKLFSSKCVICIAPIVLSKVAKLKIKKFEAKKIINSDRHPMSHILHGLKFIKIQIWNDSVYKKWSDQLNKKNTRFCSIVLHKMYLIHL